MITVLDDGPCACCERNPRGCTEHGCACCLGTGREFWPYENQEAARVFAAATLATAQIVEELAPFGGDFGFVLLRRARNMRASVHIVGALEEVELPGAFCVAEIVEGSA